MCVGGGAAPTLVNWLEAGALFLSLNGLNQSIYTHQKNNTTAGPAHKPLLLLGNGASELIDLVVRQATPG